MLLCTILPNLTLVINLYLRETKRFNGTSSNQHVFNAKSDEIRVVELV
jgi:hypothetical protein